MNIICDAPVLVRTGPVYFCRRACACARACACSCIRCPLPAAPRRLKRPPPDETSVAGCAGVNERSGRQRALGLGAGA